MARTRKPASPAWDKAKSELMRMKLEAILTEADMLFARKGFASTSLEDVASRLNITKTALYHYVKNKNELLQLCYQRSLDRTEEYYAEADETGKTGLEKLTRYLRLDAEGGVISMTPLSELEAIKNQRARKELTERINACEVKFQEFIEEGITDGSIGKCDPAMTTRFILGASRSILQWYDPDRGDDLEDIVEHFIDFCMQGLNCN